MTLMEFEVEQRIGAGLHERSGERSTYRNGYRERALNTRPGTKEVKRRSNVVGIFPNEDGITRLVGAVLMESHDDWIQGKRYPTLGTLWNQDHRQCRCDEERPNRTLDENLRRVGGRDLARFDGCARNHQTTN